MAFRAIHGGKTSRHLAVAVLILGLINAGCQKQPERSEQPTPSGVTPTTTSNTKDAAPNVSASVPTKVAAAKETNTASTPTEERQSFVQATRAADDPPAECNRPPDLTMTGKPVYKLYTEVLRLWDTIQFAAADGQRREFVAVLDTDLGIIEIALRPDVAPNHVRNFIALARAGYYDGLCFERIYHDESDVDPSTRLDEIEAGCPLGTGDPGNGSIGYWLKPEFSDKVSHEEGTVGACRGEGADTAACRFYITLSKAPQLDGNYTVFGKIVKGLDVARKIFAQPVVIDEQDADAHRRPLKPVVIHKVTIQEHETEAKR